MYRFNKLAFRTLMQNKETRYTRISGLIGISAVTLYRWIDDYQKIPVWGIVEICNALRISISSFITNDEKDTSFSYRDIVIPEDKFRPLVYDKDAIRNIYKKDGWINISKRDFVKQIGVFDKTVNNWIANEKAMRLYSLIDICNKYALNINRFIIDPNCKAAMPITTHPAGSTSYQMEQNLKKLQYENFLKSKQIDEIQEDMRKLKEENEKMHKRYSMYADISKFSVAEDFLPYGSLQPNIYSAPSKAPAVKKRRYVFNKYLFKSLPSLSGMSLDAVSSLCKISSVYVEDGSDEFRFSRLVNLCNALHISIRHFFLPEEALYIVGRPEYYFCDANTFRRITFQPDNIAALSGVDGLLGISRAHFCKAIGISSSTLTQWAKEGRQSTLSVNGLLRICNAYHISPDMFCDDPNEDIPDSYSVSAEDLLFTENLILKKIVKEQKKEMDSLRKEANLLKKEND